MHFRISNSIRNVCNIHVYISVSEFKAPEGKSPRNICTIRRIWYIYDERNSNFLSKCERFEKCNNIFFCSLLNLILDFNVRKCVRAISNDTLKLNIETKTANSKMRYFAAVNKVTVVLSSFSLSLETYWLRYLLLLLLVALHFESSIAVMHTQIGFQVAWNWFISFPVCFCFFFLCTLWFSRYVCTVQTHALDIHFQCFHTTFILPLRFVCRHFLTCTICRHVSSRLSFSPCSASFCRSVDFILSLLWLQVLVYLTFCHKSITSLRAGRSALHCKIW